MNNNACRKLLSGAYVIIHSTKLQKVKYSQTTYVTLCCKIVYFFNASTVKDYVDHKGLGLNQETLAVYTLLTLALSSYNIFATCK